MEDAVGTPDIHGKAGTLKGWPYRLALAADRFANVAFFLGDDRLTISLRAAVARGEGRRWGCVVCACLRLAYRLITAGAVADHCEQVLEPDTRPAPKTRP